MSVVLESSFDLGPLRLEYYRCTASQKLGMALLPLAKLAEVQTHRTGVSAAEGPEYAATTRLGWGVPTASLDSVVHLHLRGFAGPGQHRQGRSSHESPAGEALKFVSQVVEQKGDERWIRSHLQAAGYAVTQVVHHRAGWAAVETWTEFHNGDGPQTLEALSSFCLGRISPFAKDDAPERLILHRARAVWSGEGRLESRPIEALSLERSWIGFAGPVERFGQLGSLPTRNWFPYMAVTDQGAAVTWGVQLACPGSWQLEVLRRDDFLSLAGGLAERETGHWFKHLAPGESFRAPSAWLSCVASTRLELLADALTRAWSADHCRAPSEATLPVMANEWCTSWGKPAAAHLERLARALGPRQVRYLTIDAGWYCQKLGNWGGDLGDWLPNAELYPLGLEKTCATMRAAGCTPGLWFEFECVGRDSALWDRRAWLLQRDEQLIEAGGRRFLDLRLPAVRAYLEERVIGLLRRCHIGYLKLDYNESIGLGCDGAESPGEGLRQHLAAVQDFLRHLRRELPELVLEICASGGQRLEPSFLSLADMGSFSDAHETREIPIIAANLQRLIPPAMSQVWAVLRPEGDAHRHAYLLAGGFLGRLCLSGDLADLSDASWDLCARAIELYRRAAPVIRDGTSEFIVSYPSDHSYRYPTGAQVILRQVPGQAVLVVAHVFDMAPAEIRVPLPFPGLLDSLTGGEAPRLLTGPAGNMLAWRPGGNFRACVALITRQ